MSNRYWAAHDNKKGTPHRIFIERLGITAYYTGGNTHWLRVLTGHRKPKNSTNDPVFMLERIKQRIVFLKEHNPNKTIKPEHYNISKEDNPTLYNLFMNPEKYTTIYHELDCFLSPKKAKKKLKKERKKSNVEKLKEEKEKAQQEVKDLVELVNELEKGEQ